MAPRQPDDPPATDDVLMAEVARGDMEAFRTLNRRYLARVVALAGRTLGDAAEAEDVAQETFLRLWRTAPNWRPNEAKVGTWLHRVALNLCFDKLSRRREEHPGDPPDAVDPAPGPSSVAQQRETADHVRAALDTLPDAQRRAITLCHYQGMRNIEAAEVMGVSIEALESLLARGRRKLREQLRALAPELLGAA
ncbi:RNA polymerase sigma factor [Candidatus Binatia bacterium]|nr:RNA polymerase sigma factor [Candidatus Binatia bacterium]